MIVKAIEPNRENVSVAPVDESNLNSLNQLSIPESHREFIPDVASSIKLASKYDDAQPLCITFGDKVVGFALYGVDESTGKWKIFRLLVGEDYQGNGIGRIALDKVISDLQTEKQAEEILITYHQDNLGAARLYSRFGFVEYGRDSEKILAKLVSDKAM